MRASVGLASAALAAAAVSALVMSQPAGAEGPPRDVAASKDLGSRLEQRISAVDTQDVTSLSHPEADVPALDCGDRPVMVFDSGLYVALKDPATAAKSPSVALERLLLQGYPNAPVEQLGSTQTVFKAGKPQAMKFRFESRNKLQASFVTTEVGGEYRVASWAICESTAKAWGR